ncbi:MAG: hypothetical protein RL662_2123 [Bacteroidota bacterium]|jgi:uncharacterized protein YoxC/predicted  nucleic acid-binding Zn-ribbon protein
MLEPIDIDINMNQNISEEAPRAAQANEEMTKSVDSMLKEIERLNKVVLDMSTALAEQRKLTADNAGEFDNAIKKIEVMEEALTKAEQQLTVYQSTLAQANTAIQEGADVSDVLNEARENMAETEATLVENALELIANQEDIAESTDDSTESIEENSVASNIMSTAIKEVCKGLGIENAAVVNAIGSTRTLTGVKTLWTRATQLLNTQLGISIGLSKAFVAGGIGLILVAIAAVVYAYKTWKEGQDEINRGLEDTRKFNESAASSASKLTAEFNRLQQGYVSLGDDLQAKKKYIDENQKSFDQLGVSIQTVNEADNLFITNAENFRKAIMMRAQAAAAMELASEKYKQAMQKMHDADVREQDPSNWEKIWNSNKFVHRDGQNVLRNSGAVSAADEEREKAEKLLKEAGEYINKNIALTNDYTNAVKEAGITQNNIIVEGSKAFYEQQKKRASERMAVLKDTQKETGEWKQAVSDYNQATEKLKIWDIAGQNKSGLSAAKKAAKAAETATTSLEKMSYDLQKRIDNARVKAIQEGATHERAAIRAEYDATQGVILKKMSEIEALEKKTGKPATEQRTQLFELDVESTRQYEHQLAVINANSKKTLDNLFAEVNSRFASELDNNIAEIKRYYEEVIREAKKADENIDITPFLTAQKKDEDRAHIDDQLRKADLDEMLEMEKAHNLASIGLTTVAEQAKFEIVKKYLQERIDLLKERGDENALKEADILEEKLKGMQSSPKSVSGLVNGALFDKIKQGFEKTGMSAEDAETKTKSLFASFQQGGAQAVSVINDIKSIFGGLDEGLDKALDAAGNIAQGFATGGIAGGAMATIGEGIKMFTSLAAVEKEHQEALRKLALAKLEMQREYNLLLIKEQLYYKQGTNIFGTNQIRGAANSILTYRDSIAQLKKEMQGEKPTLSINPFKGNVPSQIEQYKKQLQAYNDGIGALADVDIVTGSRKSGWGFWKKQKDVYSSLLDTYDDVIDKEGNLNTNRIQAILNTHKMSDENKALLESLLSLDEAAKEAEEQLKDYLSQTFGGLGDALSDSIVTAFQNGEDAAQLFKGNVTDVLDDIAKQMVFGLYLKDSFDKLEKDINNVYEDLADDKLTEEQLSKKITNILGGFFGGLDGDIEKANQFLEEFWKTAEANGFDRPEGERKGASGGFATASQDSIFELNGHMYATRQLVGDIRNDQREELLVQRTITGQLSVLVERSAYWEYLEELPQVVKKLEDIDSYGLKMKLD